MRTFLAFDIGGSFVKYGVLTEEGTFLEKHETATEAHLGGWHIIEKVKEIGTGLLDKYMASGVCISTAGQVDSKKGEILYASSLIPDYTGTPLKKILEHYFELPVEVENDVNSVGLAESWLGKGNNTKSMFCLTVGTGVGGSYIINNQLHTGHSFSSGEIGYIPIEGHQFEDLASTKALIDYVVKEKNIPAEDINGKWIFDRAKKGDEVCVQGIHRLVYYLSKGIATITYIMNPEMIVIGGGITNQKDYLHPLIMEQLKKDVIPAILHKTKIEIAGTLNNAGMIGALRHFLIQESLQPFNRITTLIESSKHMLTKGETAIADYIITNLDEVPDYTISEMAEKVDVSSSMLTRFCKKLGISSYSRLRLMAKEAIVGGRIHDKPDTTSLVEVKQEYITILNKLETLNKGHDLMRFADQLRDAKRIFFYGFDEMSFVVTQIKYKLMKLGIIVDCFSHPYEMDMSKELLNSNTVVVGLSVSGSNTDIHHVFEAAKEKRALTIGITSQKNTPIYFEAEMSYLIPSSNGDMMSSVHESSTMLLLEIFLKELYSLREKAAM